MSFFNKKKYFELNLFYENYYKKYNAFFFINYIFNNKIFIY